MPATPCDEIILRNDNGDLHGAPINSSGLTKREHFAGLAMQGFIAAGVNGMPDAIELSILATHYADTLLKTLGEHHDI